MEEKELALDSKIRSISSNAAKMILFKLMQAVAPNLQQEIKIEPKEI